MRTITVVTVCYNAVNLIEKTIQSVITQIDPPCEYIIKDGNSTDGTCEIIQKYVQRYPWIKYISSNDAGLYDAMNIAAAQSTGKYIIFMNSGDVFFSDRVLHDINGQIAAQPEVKLWYGDVIRDHGENGTVEEKYRDGRMYVLGMLLSGRMPCHQSVITSAELVHKYPFDLSYSITADFHFLMQCCRERCSMKHIPEFVAISEAENGISAQKDNLNAMREQDDRSIRELYQGIYRAIRPIKTIGRYLSDRKR